MVTIRCLLASRAQNLSRASATIFSFFLPRVLSPSAHVLKLVSEIGKPRVGALSSHKLVKKLNHVLLRLKVSGNISSFLFFIAPMPTGIGIGQALNSFHWAIFSFAFVITSERRTSQLPSDAQKDDLGLEVPLLKGWGVGCRESGLT